MATVYLSASTQENNKGTDGISEEQRMNALARDVGDIVTKAGISVLYNDSRWLPADIVADSNLKEPDLHLALHTNAGGGTGIETWTYKLSGTQSAAFGRNLQTALVATLGLNDRGLKDATVKGHRWDEVYKTKATAVLTEVFFHDNASDIARFNERRLQLIRAIAQVICEWFEIEMPSLPDENTVADASKIKIKVGARLIEGMIIDNRSYAPVRELAEALGHKVEWDDKKRTVKILL